MRKSILAHKPNKKIFFTVTSETKLNNNSNCNDKQLPGYTFVNKNSLTQAGGVGIYVKINLIYEIRSDLGLHNDYIEDI